MIGWWPAKATTFVDNHDTGSTQHLWPFPSDKDTPTSSPTPATHASNSESSCCKLIDELKINSAKLFQFYDHFFDWGLKDEIERLKPAGDPPGAGALLLALAELKRADAARDGSHEREIYKCAHGPAIRQNDVTVHPSSYSVPTQPNEQYPPGHGHIRKFPSCGCHLSQHLPF
uniref:Alpha-amylase n=1 Tax=Oryza rufipogon TaxID=4529 RepID=A0A0E0MW47_ORYRU